MTSIFKRCMSECCALWVFFASRRNDEPRHSDAHSLRSERAPQRNPTPHVIAALLPPHFWAGAENSG